MDSTPTVGPSGVIPSNGPHPQTSGESTVGIARVVLGSSSRGSCESSISLEPGPSGFQGFVRGFYEKKQRVLQGMAERTYSIPDPAAQVKDLQPPARQERHFDPAGELEKAERSLAALDADSKVVARRTSASEGEPAPLEQRKACFRRMKIEAYYELLKASMTREELKKYGLEELPRDSLEAVNAMLDAAKEVRQTSLPSGLLLNYLYEDDDKIVSAYPKILRAFSEQERRKFCSEPLPRDKKAAAEQIRDAILARERASFFAKRDQGAGGSGRVGVSRKPPSCRPERKAPAPKEPEKGAERNSAKTESSEFSSSRSTSSSSTSDDESITTTRATSSKERRVRMARAPVGWNFCAMVLAVTLITSVGVLAAMRFRGS